MYRISTAYTKICISLDKSLSSVRLDTTARFQSYVLIKWFHRVYSVIFRLAYL